MIIGTAGHIDHGKSALVEALTGRTMDPLAEERRRGITLDLHFAPLRIGESRAGVIDVPGHEDLIRTMVAGAAGLDLVLLIIAADEGIMPQTREHLAILEQLRIPFGIPVLTKADLVDDAWLELVTGEVSTWLARSPVRFFPPIATSIVNRAGVEELRTAIERAGRELPGRSTTDLFRLPVDRTLSLPGVGTVVTGTAWTGRLRIGDTVRLLPGGAEGRVRSLERHGEPVSETVPGERVAAGLAGVEREQVHRGDVLVLREDPWLVTRAIDVAIDLLPGMPRPLVHHSRVRLHLGTAEILARVHTGSSIPPGGSGLARLSLESPIVARGADRFVLRNYSPVETIGGGWVVDPAPSPGRPLWPEGISSGQAGSRLVALTSRRRNGLEVTGIPVVLGTPPGATPVLLSQSSMQQSEGFLVTPESVARVQAMALALVERHHQAHPAEPGMPLETLRQQLARQGPAGSLALDQLTRDRTLLVEGGSVRVASFQRRQVESGEVARVLALVEQGGLSPPNVAELESKLRLMGVGEILRRLAQTGQVEAVERDRFFSKGALAGFTEVLARVGGAGPITPQTLREATGLSRKFLIPLLEWADRTGWTIRSGDIRRLAPRRATFPT